MERYKYTLSLTNQAVAAVAQQVLRLTDVCTCGQGSEAEAVGIITMQCVERMQATYLTLLHATNELLEVGKIIKKPVDSEEQPAWI